MADDKPILPGSIWDWMGRTIYTAHRLARGLEAIPTGAVLEQLANQVGEDFERIQHRVQGNRRDGTACSLADKRLLFEATLRRCLEICGADAPPQTPAPAPPPAMFLIGLAVAVPQHPCPEQLQALDRIRAAGRQMQRIIQRGTAPMDACLMGDLAAIAEQLVTLYRRALASAERNDAPPDGVL